mmetsp:Transcript_36711/g.79976  ORF Transcript_36711/g.79976 Transcript_36711/m.79976 type:complete len:246 (-) Transcript_36711:908-1645(-)
MSGSPAKGCEARYCSSTLALWLSGCGRAQPRSTQLMTAAGATSAARRCANRRCSFSYASCSDVRLLFVRSFPGRAWSCAAFLVSSVVSALCLGASLENPANPSVGLVPTSSPPRRAAATASGGALVLGDLPVLGDLLVLPSTLRPATLSPLDPSGSVVTPPPPLKSMLGRSKFMAVYATPLARSVPLRGAPPPTDIVEKSCVPFPSLPPTLDRNLDRPSSIASVSGVSLLKGEMGGCFSLFRSGE